MDMQRKEPTIDEMAAIVSRAERCFQCDAPDCFEFTPEGVDVCAGIHYWSGKPVTKPMLLTWRERLEEEKA